MGRSHEGGARLVRDPSGETLRRALSALGEPHRFWLVRALLERPRSVGELVALSRWPQPLVSHHLAGLSRAGLVTTRRQGRRRLYRTDGSGHPGLERLLLLVRSSGPGRFEEEAPPPGAAGLGPESASPSGSGPADPPPGGRSEDRSPEEERSAAPSSRPGAGSGADDGKDAEEEGDPPPGPAEDLEDYLL